MDITVQELKQKKEEGAEFILIDVREPYENEEFNLGGQLVPIGEFQGKIEDFEEHKNDEIIVYCRSGARSGMAKGLMQAAGYSNVRNLLGGVLAWQEAFGE